MIRLVQRQLIIPRGDTGTFSIPAIAKSEMGDASIFTIFDPLKHKKIFEKEMQLSDGVLSIDFTHGDTVNLPVGQFVWDIKFYKNVRKVDGLFVDGDEIDSYYAAFKLPVCEIRQTGDALLSADDAPTSTIAPEQLNVILAAGRQIHDAQVAVAADAAEVTEMKGLTEQMKDTAIDAADTATAAATSADASASAAQQDAASAADSMAQALVAQAAAETAQSAAEASEANALLYKNAASASATAASQAAGTATTKAQEAAASATSAANSVIEMQAAVAAIPTRVGEFENDVGYLVENDLASVAMSGDYEDLENKPFIPTRVSDLTDDGGHYIKPATGIPASDLEETYLTSFIETDPTVPAWAKAAQKPTYTAQEVGALPANTHIPSTTQELTNDAGFITAAALPTKVSDLVDDSGHYTKPVAGIPASDLEETYLTQHQDISMKVNSTDLATVATSGSYEDLEDKPTIPEVPVQDVQIGDFSILHDGIASIPVATTHSPGVFAIGSGLKIINEHFVGADRAAASVIKTGTSTDKLLTAQNTHYVTFYGLAKAAGDTTQSQSDNAVGQYTNSAKTAIQQMLDVPSTSVVTSEIAAAIGNINSFDMSVVQALPTENISNHTIYLVPKTGETNDVYDEYVYVNNGWEMVGNTQIDLSNYVQKTDYATSSTAGLVRFNTTSGFTIGINGAVFLDAATPNETKAGTITYKSITPFTVSHAAFYGLAKAAGSDEKDSELPLGTYSTAAKSAIRSMIGAAASSDITVTDIQIKNTSILSNGIANIPIATGSTPGLIVTNGTDYGIWFDNAHDNRPYISRATDANIKAANSAFKPIVPENQHQAVFYGLAKAAGDSTQSSSDNAVGTYTAEAKAAIQQMLGVPSTSDIPDTSIYATKADTVLETSLSRGRKANTTIGVGSFAFGEDVEARGDYSFAIGRNTQAVGPYGHAEGVQTYAASGAHAEGISTKASIAGAHTEGYMTYARGSYASHSEGYMTNALGLTSHSEGLYTLATADTAHSEGYGTAAIGHFSHSSGEGYIGYLSISGPENTVNYTYSYAASDPEFVITKGSLIFIAQSNKWTYISDIDSVNKIITVTKTLGAALENQSVRLIDNIAYGNASSVSGLHNVANGYYQQVTGIFSSSESQYSIWTPNTQYYIGNCVSSPVGVGYQCIVDNNDAQFDEAHWKRIIYNTEHIYIIGNGTGTNARSNAYALTWTGDGHYAGDVYVHSNADSSGGVKLATIEDLNNAIAIQTTEPTDPDTKIWIDGDASTTIQVPTVAEMNAALAGKVDDVQIDGTSIVSNGVAHIPLASSSNVGLVKGAQLGVSIDADGGLRLMDTTEYQFQIGASRIRAVMPYAQHWATFYGLSKAAGVDLANETVTFGTYPETSKTAIQTMLGVPGDVQINGTSIVTNGIANIPVAGSSLGVVKVSNTYGLTMGGTNSQFIQIHGAPSSDVKNGTHASRPLVPIHQHEAAFYGLAKAAGADEKDSTLSVGTYSDTAKAAIRSMIGATNGDVIAIQDTQPTANDVKLWLPETMPAAVDVPTMNDLEDYVKKTDYATDTVGGVVKVNSGNGIGITSGNIYIQRANTTDIKTGTNNYKPIVPNYLPEAIFYGLAKTAGADMASSDNAIGTYTDAAKSAICNMIGAIKTTDIANSTTAGIMKVTTGGLGLVINSDNILQVSPADTATIKAGTQGYRPITAGKQHESVFYGLTKAAGVDMASSDNAVGTYTDTAKSAIRNMIGAISNTDYGTRNTAGVVKFQEEFGVNIGTNSKCAFVVTADLDLVKGGTNYYRPVTPAHEHEAAFYGLAKAAGDTTQSASSNAVGTYTSEAKAAIHTMLGIDPASIAAQVDIPLVETVSGTTPTITGQPNVRYVCGEVSTITITPPASGSVDVIFESGSTPAVMTVPNTVKWPAWFDATTLDTGTTYEILITDGVYGSVMTWAT